MMTFTGNGILNKNFYAFSFRVPL